MLRKLHRFQYVVECRAADGTRASYGGSRGRIAIGVDVFGALDEVRLNMPRIVARDWVHVLIWPEGVPEKALTYWNTQHTMERA